MINLHEAKFERDSADRCLVMEQQSLIRIFSELNQNNLLAWKAQLLTGRVDADSTTQYDNGVTGNSGCMQGACGTALTIDSANVLQGT
jgi:hypothetical protein